MACGPYTLAIQDLRLGLQRYGFKPRPVWTDPADINRQVEQWVHGHAGPPSIGCLINVELFKPALYETHLARAAAWVLAEAPEILSTFKRRAW